MPAIAVLAHDESPISLSNSLLIVGTDTVATQADSLKGDTLYFHLTRPLPEGVQDVTVLVRIPREILPRKNGSSTSILKRIPIP